METYFVQHGLLNGENGVYAMTAGVGIQQKDGWYYLPAGADDGIGPFVNKKAALEAAEDEE